MEEAEEEEEEVEERAAEMETEEGVGRHGAERESILATQPVDEVGTVLRSWAAAGVYPASE